MVRFNYVITIHNKEQLLHEVLARVLMCAREGSHIYPVLDGCTDRSEQVVDDLVASCADVPVTKVTTSDVHELRTINAGLRAADHAGDGYTIVLQDDVLLADFSLERKIAALYGWAGPDLAYVSLRLAADFDADARTSSVDVPYRHYVENAYGHGISGADMLLPGRFARRSVPIKSPVCLPFWVVRDFGGFDERLAPYGHDDPELALRLLAAGYFNGAFAVRFKSDVAWGGTRTTPHPELDAVIARNMNQIRDWHGDTLERVASDTAAPLPAQEVPGLVSAAQDLDAAQAWERNRGDLARFTGRRTLTSKVTARAKSMLNL